MPKISKRNQPSAIPSSGFLISRSPWTRQCGQAGRYAKRTLNRRRILALHAGDHRRKQRSHRPSSVQHVGEWRILNHAKLAEKSPKSTGVARCRMPEVWEGDLACGSAPHRLRACRVSGLARTARRSPLLASILWVVLSLKIISSRRGAHDWLSSSETFGCSFVLDFLSC